jgi:hypothetical protein
MSPPSSTCTIPDYFIPEPGYYMCPSDQAGFIAFSIITLAIRTLGNYFSLLTHRRLNRKRKETTTRRPSQLVRMKRFPLSVFFVTLNTLTMYLSIILAGTGMTQGPNGTSLPLHGIVHFLHFLGTMTFTLKLAHVNEKVIQAKMSLVVRLLLVLCFPCITTYMLLCLMAPSTLIFPNGPAFALNISWYFHIIASCTAMGAIIYSCWSTERIIERHLLMMDTTDGGDNTNTNNIGIPTAVITSTASLPNNNNNNNQLMLSSSPHSSSSYGGGGGGGGGNIGGSSSTGNNNNNNVPSNSGQAMNKQKLIQTRHRLFRTIAAFASILCSAIGLNVSFMSGVKLHWYLAVFIYFVFTIDDMAPFLAVWVGKTRQQHKKRKIDQEITVMASAPVQTEPFQGSVSGVT